ncbi:hypothetical protein HZA97_05190 [Candidatus Woesearchaeota archaeon]|nr:hypothetical protein [Candidatus Woesearchaeota archaeon]
MNLYNKLKTGISTVLLGTVIYASAILPVQAQEAPQQLPPAQTQQATEHPAKWALLPKDRQRYEQNQGAFSAYITAYDSLAADGDISLDDRIVLEKVLSKLKCEKFGVYSGFENYEGYFFYLTAQGRIPISSCQVERLEKKLAEEISEFEKEYTDENKKLNVVTGETAKAYLTYLSRKKDLGLLREALKVKEEYLNKGWHNNSFISAGATQNKSYANDKSYRSSLEEVFNNDFYILVQKPCKIINLTDEFPVKTKIPFWPGLLFGLTPLLAQLARKIKRKNITLRNQMFPILIHGNGIMCYDALHPLVYPIRVGGGLAWEAYEMYKYNKANKPQQPKPSKPKKPTNIDPWCDLEEPQEKPEQKTIDPWVKLESKVQ